jgi:hypothetical protein
MWVVMWKGKAEKEAGSDNWMVTVCAVVRFLHLGEN